MIRILLAVLLLGTAARADSLVTVTVQNVVLQYDETVNISMELDLTNLTVLSSDAMITGPIPINLTIAPLCPDAPSAPLCSLFTSDSLALFNFDSNVDKPGTGFMVQLGDDDYTESYFQGLAFPQIGTYNSSIVSGGYGYSYNVGNGGSVTIVDPPDTRSVPETGTVALLAIGILGVLVIDRKFCQ